MGMLHGLFRSRPLATGLLLAGCGIILLVFASTFVGKVEPSTSPTAAQGLKPLPQEPTKPVHMIVQPGTWFGYRDRDFLKDAIKLGLRGNKDAWERLTAEGVTDGPIIPLKPGEEVLFVDIDIPVGMTKVRREGEANGWWTNIEAVLAH